MTLPIRSLAAVCLAAFASAAVAADLEVAVAGVSDSKGQVMVAVYAKDDPWMGKARIRQMTDAVRGTTRIVVRDLPAGDYALSVFHDEDGDRKLLRNAMGMPLEPWGFSNDALGNFGPPTFEQARVVVPAAGAAIVVNLRS